MNNADKKVVLITGASSGIGLDVAKRLLSLGYIVYGAARRIELMKDIEEKDGHALFLDLTSEQSICECVDKIIKKEGKIDVLVNNAGYGLGGALETVPISDAKNQLEVNIFGLARLTQLVLPFMRENKYGRIVNISSIAGKFSSPFLGWYHVSKYAVEAYSDALRMEVKKFGIKVSIIEPGLIQTDWGLIAEKHIRKYSEKTVYEKDGKIVGDFYNHYYEGKKASDISVVSKTIIKAITSKRPKLRYNPGKFSKLFTFTAKIVPDFLLDFIVSRVYNISDNL